MPRIPFWPFTSRGHSAPATSVFTKASLAGSAQPDRPSVWPPPEHEERLARYERYRNLYMGRHFEVFHDPLRGADHDLFAQYYITVNLAAQVSQVAADLLFGEPPQFAAERDSLQGLIDNLVRRNDLVSQLQRAARGQSYRGDAVFKVCWEPDAETGGRVILAPLAPDMYFPVFHPDDPNQVESVWVAWLRPDARGEPTILRVEVHTPGRIQNLAFPYRNGRLGSPLPIENLSPGLPEEVITGLDEIPLVHIPNAQTDDSGPFGISDYAFFEPIQREINNRLSQIGTVLDKHADPNMVIPLQALDAQGEFRAVTQKAWPIDQGDPRPEYITWDGKLESAFRELEMLKEFFFLASGVSPSTLGVSTGTGLGGSTESGRAIQLRQIRTLKWIENKRASWTTGLKRLFRIAQKLLIAHGGFPAGERAEPTPVQILWRDGLPTDRAADIDDAVRAVGGGVMSLRRGIQLAQGLEGEGLAGEEAQIRADRGA